MIKAVIDTNVLLTANNSHADASPQCVSECVKHLLKIQKHGVVVIDDGYRILSEYQNKTHPNQPKGSGDVFLKWLLRNMGNDTRVEQVHLTETDDEEFYEFPDQALQPNFDPSDRKFAAVAHAHADKPPIWQAVDCKWLDWWTALQKKGVTVEFLCPEDICRFYRQKFPNRLPLKLPDNA